MRCGVAAWLVVLMVVLGASSVHAEEPLVAVWIAEVADEVVLVEVPPGEGIVVDRADAGLRITEVQGEGGRVARLEVPCLGREGACVAVNALPRTVRWEVRAPRGVRVGRLQYAAPVRAWEAAYGALLEWAERGGELPELPRELRAWMAAADLEAQWLEHAMGTEAARVSRALRSLEGLARFETLQPTVHRIEPVGVFEALPAVPDGWRRLDAGASLRVGCRDDSTLELTARAVGLDARVEVDLDGRPTEAAPLLSARGAGSFGPTTVLRVLLTAGCRDVTVRVLGAPVHVQARLVTRRPRLTSMLSGGESRSFWRARLAALPEPARSVVGWLRGEGDARLASEPPVGALLHAMAEGDIERLAEAVHTRLDAGVLDAWDRSVVWSALWRLEPTRRRSVLARLEDRDLVLEAALRWPDELPPEAERILGDAVAMDPLDARARRARSLVRSAGSLGWRSAVRDAGSLPERRAFVPAARGEWVRVGTAPVEVVAHVAEDGWVVPIEVAFADREQAALVVDGVALRGRSDAAELVVAAGRHTFRAPFGAYLHVGPSVEVATPERFAQRTFVELTASQTVEWRATASHLRVDLRGGAMGAELRVIGGDDSRLVQLDEGAEAVLELASPRGVRVEVLRGGALVSVRERARLTARDASLAAPIEASFEALEEATRDVWRRAGTAQAHCARAGLLASLGRVDLARADCPSLDPAPRDVVRAHFVGPARLLRPALDPADAEAGVAVLGAPRWAEVRSAFEARCADARGPECLGLADRLLAEVADPDVRRIRGEVLVRSRWVQVGVTASAGSGVREVEPDLGADEALIRALVPMAGGIAAGLLLRPSSRVGVRVEGTIERVAEVEAVCGSLPGFDPAPCALEVLVDGEVETAFELETGATATGARVRLPPGRHALELRLGERPGALARGRFVLDGGEVRSLERQSVVWVEPGQALTTTVLGPTTLRVRRWEGGEVRLRTRGPSGVVEEPLGFVAGPGPFADAIVPLIDRGPIEISLLATAPAAVSLALRTSRPLDEASEDSAAALPADAEPAVTSGPLWRVPAFRTVGSPSDLGTLSLEARVFQSDVTDADEPPRPAPYVGFGVAHRLALVRRSLWLRTELDGRFRTESDPAVGLRLALTATQLPLGFRTQLELGGDVTSGAASVRGRLRLDRPLTLNPDLVLVPSLRVELTWQSLADAASQVDFDVWSAFRRDHPWGLSPGLEARVRVAQDARLDVGVVLLTNSDLTPDRLQAGLTALVVGQLPSPVTIQLSYRPGLRFSDAHRARTYLRHDVALTLRWVPWLDDSARLRIEAGGQLFAWDRGIDGIFSFAVGVDLTSGRRLRDFTPLELPLAGLLDDRSYTP